MADPDEILAVLQAAGARVTRPRRAVIGALLAADGHVTADELARTVQKAEPDVHLSTVYRSLDALERLGVVVHVHLGHGRAVYHLAGDPHQHLVCEACGTVVEVPMSWFDGLARRAHAEHGFRIRPEHFAVLGRCADCPEA